MADKFQLKALITGVDRLSPVLTGIHKKVAAFRKQLKDAGGKISIMEAGAMAAPVALVATAAIQFEDAMADVRKVAEFKVPEQFARMGLEVRNLSTALPVAATELAGLYAAGASSGLANDELKSFAESAAKMGVAFGQTAEDAGAQMSAWRAGMKLTQDGAAKLADQINYLDSKGNSAAKNVAKIVTEIGPLAQISGVAAGDTAALAATMDAVKVPADVAATGIKNFLKTLTAGKSASKSVKETFKALRMDPSQIAANMQKDSRSTINKVLKTISSVSKDKQAAVLTELFGSESVSAIAPFLSNLDMLQENFQLVGDAAGYAGSMQGEFDVRANTTSGRMAVFKNRVVDVGIAFGDMLLPPLNATLEILGPIVKSVSAFTQAHPELVKTVLAGAAGYVTYRAALWAATLATEGFSKALKISPIGIFITALGGLIANWDRVAAAAGNAAAKNRLALASADQAAMEGDPNSIRKSIEEAEARLDKLRAEKRRHLENRPKRGSGVIDEGMARLDEERARKAAARFDKDIDDTQAALRKLKKSKKNAEVIQREEAMSALPESDPGMSPVLDRLDRMAQGGKVEVKVDIANAPPGTRVSSKEVGGGLTVNQNVGYRSYAAAGAG
ncbi:phage tail tape measure protein [Laribacter hongkongensis]|nr:phage tail tape measure protein [Laribacter hongkongensis]